MSFVALVLLQTLEVQAGPRHRETRHKVSARLEESIVRLHVVREFEIHPRAESSIEFDLPPHSVLVDFRAGFEGKWFPGQLLSNEMADQEFENAQVEVPEFLDEGKTVEDLRAKFSNVPLSDFPPVVLRQFGKRVELEIPKFHRARRLQVQYELTSPTCYHQGRNYLLYPNSFVFEEDDFEAKYKKATLVAPGAKREKELPQDETGFLQIACHASGDGQVVSWPTARRTPPASKELRKRQAKGIPTAVSIFARWGRNPVQGREFGRLEIESPMVLAAPPKSAKVIFVLDASRSMENGAIDRQLRIAETILARLPAARAEVILVRRQAQRLFGKWLGLSAFRTLVKREAPKIYRGNGSHMERGLAMAANLLADEAGPIRIYAMGDGSMRERWEQDATYLAMENLPKHAVMHWIQLRPESNEKTDSELSTGGDTFHELASHHLGQSWSLFGKTRGKQFQSQLERLIRPHHIENFRIEVSQELQEELGSFSPLSEGIGFREMFVDVRLPQEVVLRGLIWGQKWSQTVRRDDSFSKASAALALGDWIIGDLEEAEIAALAFRENALSDETSFLVRDPHRLYLPNPTGFGFSGTGSGST